MGTGAVEAPFARDQAASLNAYQFSGAFHPFTCPREHCWPGESPRLHVLLVALEEGWRCAGEGCDYTQGWAHAWMADWRWRDLRVGWANIRSEEDSDSTIARELG